MTPTSTPTLKDSRKALTDSDVKTLQVVAATMGLGVLTFVVVVVGLYLGPMSERRADGLGILPVLTIVSMAVFLACLPLSAILGRTLVSRALATASGEDLPVRGVQALRTATVVRLALLEAAAILGVMVCLLGTLTGALRNAPLYWVNLLPAAVFLMILMLTFPGRARLEQAVEDGLRNRPTR
jgi:hypothetical protein